MTDTKHPGPAASPGQISYWRECNEKRAAKGQPLLTYPRASPNSKQYLDAIAAGWKPEDGFPTGEDAPKIVISFDPATDNAAVAEVKGDTLEVLAAGPITELPPLAQSAAIENIYSRITESALTAKFREWLGTPEGYSASDSRLPTDPVRLGSEIDDRLRIAFLAGARIGGGK